MSEEVRPFELDVAEAELTDLRRRLDATRWPESEAVDDWSQGIPLAYTQEICRYWSKEYDWRRCETMLNGWPQFITEIDGVDIHFLHIRSPNPNALPLVITHGWPGSIIEFHKVFGPLADPVNHGGEVSDAFHIVAPTLPGFGFSGKPDRHGWSVEKIAEAWAKLMARLGYQHYVAQGGDWGSAISSAIGAQDPDHCDAIHLNMVSAGPMKEDLKNPSDRVKDALAGLKHYQDWDSGYSKQQGTRPQTMGYGLVDSPTGQLAWIMEKFWAWTDCDGHPENSLSRDEMLDNIMFYWLPAAGASSARIYWESFGKARPYEIAVPTGCSIFPKDIFRPIRKWVQKRYTNITYWNELDEGGHFAAFEKPDIFTAELRKFFRTIR